LFANIKAEVLKRIREVKAEDGFISGQRLCRELSVSRTAVWKAVSALKEAGYEIESVTNKGYRLISSPDILTDSELLSRMDTEFVGRELLVFEVTDSTNEELKRRYTELSDGAVAVADSQSAGKGRRGRVWETPPGENIALSVFLKPDMDPSRASMLTIVAAMAMLDTCREAGLDVSIKWPNDVVSEGKKLCGILTEMSAEPDFINYVIVGVGVNVNRKGFPEELRDRATSFCLCAGRNFSRAYLTSLFLKFFEQRYKGFLKTCDLSGIMDEYNEVLAGKGSKVRVLDPKGEYEGISRGINKTGELLVETDEGDIREVYSGEVSVRGVYGYV